MSPDFDIAAYGAAVMFIAWAFVAIGERLLDARDRRRVVDEALSLEPGTITEVRPNLYVVADPPCQVIDARARFEARRAQAMGPMGGAA